MDTETSSASVAVAVSPAITRNVVIAVGASVIAAAAAAAIVKWKKARDTSDSKDYSEMEEAIRNSKK